MGIWYFLSHQFLNLAGLYSTQYNMLPGKTVSLIIFFFHRIIVVLG